MPLKFVAKGAKKVFRRARKVSRQIRKPAAIAGLTFFAAGLGTVGFGAFTGQAGADIGGFFKAVGQTTMAGAQGLAGSLGLGQGVSEGLGESLGAEAGGTLFGGNTGRFAAEQSRTLGNVLGGLGGGSSGSADGEEGLPAGGSTFGRQLAFAAVSSGAQQWLAGRQFKKEEKRLNRRNFFGGPARGGTADPVARVPQVSNPSDLANNLSNPDGLFDQFDPTGDLFEELNQPRNLWGNFT